MLKKIKLTAYVVFTYLSVLYLVVVLIPVITYYKQLTLPNKHAIINQSDYLSNCSWRYYKIMELLRKIQHNIHTMTKRQQLL